MFTNALVNVFSMLGALDLCKSKDPIHFKTHLAN